MSITLHNRHAPSQFYRTAAFVGEKQDESLVDRWFNTSAGKHVLAAMFAPLSAGLWLFLDLRVTASSVAETLNDIVIE